jgi:hypothetical protein
MYQWSTPCNSSPQIPRKTTLGIRKGSLKATPPRRKIMHKHHRRPTQDLRYSPWRKSRLRTRYATPKLESSSVAPTCRGCSCKSSKTRLMGNMSEVDGKSRKPSPSTSSCEAKSSLPPRLPPPLLYYDLLNCCVHHGVNIQRSYTPIVSKGFTLIAKVKCTYHQHEGKKIFGYIVAKCAYTLLIWNAS